MTTIKSLAYLIAWAALIVWTVPVGRWLIASGMSINMVIFLWIIVVACFSWSAAAWLIRREHW